VAPVCSVATHYLYKPFLGLFHPRRGCGVVITAAVEAKQTQSGVLGGIFSLFDDNCIAQTQGKISCSLVLKLKK